MNLQLIRHQDGYRVSGIFSSLLTDDGNDKIIATTVEHSYDRDNPQVLVASSHYFAHLFIPKIPPGRFPCVRGWHKLENGEKFETFEVTGIVGHMGLLFHWGNYGLNSLGCILTGEEEVPADDRTNAYHVDMITNTRKTFKKFMALQAGVDEFTLTVIE